MTIALPGAEPFYALRPGVSFCRVEDRIVFLDVRADRYFCLSPSAEQAFRRLVDRDPLDDSHRYALQKLARSGPLRHADTRSVIAPCRPVDVPLRSRLDQPDRPGIADTVEAAASLVLSPVRLRVFGLRRTLGRIDRRKRLASGRGAPGRQARVAAAFARLRLLATEQDNCLVRSIAVADRLVGTGARPDLVIAVKLRPFYAHAWVQCDGWLVNDRREFVRNYTPILLI